MTLAAVGGMVLLPRADRREYDAAAGVGAVRNGVGRLSRHGRKCVQNAFLTHFVPFPGSPCGGPGFQPPSSSIQPPACLRILRFLRILRTFFTRRGFGAKKQVGKTAKTARKECVGGRESQSSYRIGLRSFAALRMTNKGGQAGRGLRARSHRIGKNRTARQSTRDTNADSSPSTPLGVGMTDNAGRGRWPRLTDPSASSLRLRSGSTLRSDRAGRNVCPTNRMEMQIPRRSLDFARDKHGGQGLGMTGRGPGEAVQVEDTGEGVDEETLRG